MLRVANLRCTPANGPVALHDFRGRAVVLYFGYTRCPDVCPLSLGKLATVIKTLPPGLRDRIVPIFVSVDSRGDTPTSVGTYATFFDPKAIGVTGTKEEIDRVTRAYGASYVLRDSPGSALGYSVEHPTSFYLVNPSGNLTATMPTEAPKEELRASLFRLIGADEGARSPEAASSTAVSPPPIPSATFRISAPSVRTVPPGARISSAYLTLENTAKTADLLLSVDSPRARVVEIHQHRTEGERMIMERVGSLPIGAGEKIIFQPHGLHLMLIDLDGNLTEGQSIPFTLHFQSGATATFTAPVESVTNLN